MDINDDTEGILTNAYKDLLAPSAKPIGDMISLLPRSLRIGFGKWEKWLVNKEESLRLVLAATSNKLNDIPEEKQCEPEPYVAIPTIQQIAYCFDSKELRDMYANLLVSSMNQDKKWNVHPSYVDIIKQLSPDEAKLLKEFKNHSYISYPLIDLYAKLKNSEGQRRIALNITGDNLYSICDKPDNMSFYIDNLVRLQLICVTDQMQLQSDHIYNLLLDSRFSKKHMGEIHDNEELASKRKIFYISEYGLSFAKCCTE